MLRIRLSMGGVRKRPIYKIVVADGRYPRDGKFIEKIGFNSKEWIEGLDIRVSKVNKTN